MPPCEQDMVLHKVLSTLQAVTNCGGIDGVVACWNLQPAELQETLEFARVHLLRSCDRAVYSLRYLSQGKEEITIAECRTN